jgi:hypothetical protein
VVEIDLQKQNMYIFGISKQCATRKSALSIHRATSKFDLHMRIFNLQGLEAPDRPKKKYAEIIFISCYNFLREGWDQSLPNCIKIQPTVYRQHKIYGNIHRSAFYN